MHMARKWGYDYALTIATVVILLAIGAISLYSIGYYHQATQQDAGWIGSQKQTAYLEMMNRFAFPVLVLLIIALGMCIPKRVVPREALNRISAVILGATVFLYAGQSIAWGLGFLLFTAIGIQAISLALTLLKRGRLVYEKEGYLVQLGSALLHMGTIILILDIALLRQHALHISIFWIATILVLIGMFLSFYGRTDPRRWLSAIKS